MVYGWLCRHSPSPAQHSSSNSDAIVFIRSFISFSDSLFFIIGFIMSIICEFNIFSYDFLWGKCWKRLYLISLPLYQTLRQTSNTHPTSVERVLTLMILCESLVGAIIPVVSVCQIVEGRFPLKDWPWPQWPERRSKIFTWFVSILMPCREQEDICRYVSWCGTYFETMAS